MHFRNFRIYFKQWRNGYFKTTDFKNDQILMSAVRPGGKNNYGLADKYNAEYMIPVISGMGVGDFSPVDLKKSLQEKQ